MNSNLYQKHSCPKCSTEFEYPAAWKQPEYFICPHCKSSYTWQFNQWTFLGVKEIFIPQYIKLGAKLSFDNEDYIIVGVSMHQMNNTNYTWGEYLLIGESGKRILLNETDGHWVKFQEFFSDVSDYRYSKIIADDVIFDKIYQYTSKLKKCAGFFDFNIFSEAFTKEFINPPQHLIYENRKGETSHFLGEYISIRALKNALKEPTYLPTPSGVGASEPFYFNIDVNVFIQIIIVTLTILFGINSVFNYSHKKEVIYDNKSYLVDSLSNKITVTPTFELKDRIAPLEIYLETDLSNGWLEYGITLINEDTGEERDFEIGVEYYSGGTGEDAWAEGCKNNNFTLCKVKPGKYHLELQPVIGTNGFNSRITFIRGQSYYTTILVCLLVGVALIILISYLSSEFEKSRWAFSNAQ